MKEDRKKRKIKETEEVDLDLHNKFGNEVQSALSQAFIWGTGQPNPYLQEKPSDHRRANAAPQMASVLAGKTSNLLDMSPTVRQDENKRNSSA